MAGVSLIDRLTVEVQNLVTQMFAEGYTIDEVTAFLQQAGHDISRSSVGRKRRAWFELNQRVRERLEEARILAQSFVGESDAEVGQANITMMQALVSGVLRAALGGEDEEDEASDASTKNKPQRNKLGSSDISQMARALRDLMAANKLKQEADAMALKLSREVPVFDTEKGNVLELRFVEPAPRNPDGTAIEENGKEKNLAVQGIEPEPETADNK